MTPQCVSTDAASLLVDALRKVRRRDYIAIHTAMYNLLTIDHLENII